MSRENKIPLVMGTCQSNTYVCKVVTRSPRWPGHSIHYIIWSIRYGPYLPLVKYRNRHKNWWLQALVLSSSFCLKKSGRSNVMKPPVAFFGFQGIIHFTVSINSIQKSDPTIAKITIASFPKTGARVPCIGFDLKSSDRSIYQHFCL